MPDYHGFGSTFGERGSRYVYDSLSYDKKIMISEGELLPIYLEEVIPGSIFGDEDSYVLKNIPSPYRAVFDDCYLDFNYFFVPKRLLWDKFPQFIGADATPDAYTDPQEYTEPLFDLADILGNTKIERFSVLNCLGLPATTGDAIGVVNLAPLAAVAFCWNEFYRDENLQDENPFYFIHKELASGAIVKAADMSGSDLEWAWKKDADSLFCRVNKYKDLFTSALRSPQKGNAPLLPLGTSAPLDVSNVTTGIEVNFKNMGSYEFGGGNSTQITADPDISAVQPDGVMQYLGADSGADQNRLLAFVNKNSLKNQVSVDLSQATAASIADLEKAVFGMQYLRALAVGGTRYNELLRFVYGTSPRDDTLQRPEFLGTLHKRVQFNQVASTAGTSDDSDTNRPTGALGGYMQAAGDQGIYVRQFKEHGYIVGFASIRIKHSYGQGVPKIFQKKNRFDYFNRFFGRLGLVPVMKSELFAGASGVFGFQESWYENKNHPDEVGGFSDPDLPADLAAFTYADTYGSAQYLSSEFIQEKRTNIDQTLVGATGIPQFVLGVHHKVRATTQVPLDSMPKGL